MVPRLGLIAVLTVVSTALLSSCTDEPTTKPEPTRTSTTTNTTTATTPRDSPPVQEPLDSKNFAADPCTSLTPAQLAELKLGNPEKAEVDGADLSKDACIYTDFDPDTQLFVYVNYYPHISDGLEARYFEHRELGLWPVWHPIEVSGYPAVAFRPKDDKTGCLVDVGLSDTDFFNVKYYYFGWEGYDGRDTCAAATTVAAAVLATIKAAN